MYSSLGMPLYSRVALAQDTGTGRVGSARISAIASGLASGPPFSITAFHAARSSSPESMQIARTKSRWIPKCRPDQRWR